jgi:IS30 family transposase
MPHMNEVIRALYQAVYQNEEHATTINHHLDLLRAARRNARRDQNQATYAWCEKEIVRYTERLGTIHAERADLARRIARAKGLSNADLD